MFQQGFEGRALKQGLRHQTTLFDEPDKNQPRQQANHADGVALLGLFATALRKVHLLDGPHIPPGQLFVEGFVKLLRGQHANPGIVKLAEVAGAALVAQVLQRQLRQDVDVGGVRVRQPHVLDDGNARVKHLAAGIAQVLAAVNHGQRQAVAIAKQHDGRHGETLVQPACDGGQLCARPCCALQFNGQKHKRFNLTGCHIAVCTQRGLPQSQRRNFVIRQLE